MIKKVSLILFLIIPAHVLADTRDLAEIRSLYRKAAEHAEWCIKLSNMQVPEKGENISVMAGYKAAATMMMAKHVFNPASKISYFRKGKKMLESAILLDTKNVELRFLRFTIQTNAPAFLGYSNSITADRQYLINAIPDIKDEALRMMISKYLSTLKV